MRNRPHVKLINRLPLWITLLGIYQPSPCDLKPRLPSRPSGLSFHPTAPEPSEIKFPAQSTSEIDPRGVVQQRFFQFGSMTKAKLNTDASFSIHPPRPLEAW